MKLMSKHLVVYRGNNSKGRKDATGAFIPEGRALAHMLTDDGRDVRRLEIITDGYKNRVELVQFVLAKMNRKLDAVSLFCHGWRRGVELLPRGEQGAKTVADVMVANRISFLNLFACSAAMVHPKGSFSQWVTERCAEQGHEVQVFGHETPGHTSWNPKVVVWWSDGSDVTHKELEKSPVTEWESFREKMRADQAYRLYLPFKLADT